MLSIWLRTFHAKPVLPHIWLRFPTMEENGQKRLKLCFPHVSLHVIKVTKRYMEVSSNTQNYVFWDLIGVLELFDSFLPKSNKCKTFLKRRLHSSYRYH